MGPPVPVGEISTEVISPLPGVDVVELKHAVIKAFYPGGSLVKLVLSEGQIFRKNSLTFQFSNDLFRFGQNLSGLLFDLICQLKPLISQGFNMALVADLFGHLLPYLLLLFFGERPPLHIYGIPPGVVDDPKV